ncbi:uncharacterized protein LOC143598026 [Bidens hawaiensis]|uniref:uncharacterized protein LOC143598026 n=1 Tax=Bidens hawaiensis TaxID=980011 RepID=UPI004049E063
MEMTKGQLQEYRENGYDKLLEKVYSFCEKYGIKILNMVENYVDDTGYRPERRSVVDMEIKEFGDRFNEINTDLLQNMLVFNPYDSFFKFDASKLMRLCEFYPYDFDNGDKIVHASQLGMYIDIVQKDERFANLKGIADLARVMVETRKHISFHLVY